MMKLIYTLSLLVLMFFLIVNINTPVISALTVNESSASSDVKSTGSVIGTSVEVVDPPDVVEIKKLEIGGVVSDGRIPVSFEVNNLDEQVVKADRFELVTKDLSGKIVQTQSLDIDTMIGIDSSKNFNISYTNTLPEGEYILELSAYDDSLLLGTTRSIFPVRYAQGEVLGASTASSEPGSVIFAAIILIATLINLTFLIAKNFSIDLKSGLAWKGVFSIMVVLTFAMGFYLGHDLTKTYFPISNGDLAENVGWRTKPQVASQTDSVDDSKIVFDYVNRPLNLYTKPDLRSEIAHEIKGDVSMIIIDTSAGWYRVIVADDISGWVRISDL